MGFLVCAGATLKCSFGNAPSSFMVLPVNRVLTKTPIANIMDNKPMVNILPFGMCSCPINPMVAAATAAAMGVLTPQPCIPLTVAPWAPGTPTVLIANMPALNNSSKLMCSYGGIIEVKNPGEQTIKCP